MIPLNHLHVFITKFFALTFDSDESNASQRVFNICFVKEMDVPGQIEYLSLQNHPKGTPIFSHGTAGKQKCLSFPKHVIDHIVMYPSTPKLWMKLIQTCKMFYNRNPIIIISCIHEDEKSIRFKTCSVGYCDNSIDRDIGGGPQKFWITENLAVSNKKEVGIAEGLIPHIYKCDAKKMELVNQALSIVEFKFLTSEVVYGSFASWVLEDDEKVIPLEKLFDCLPKILEIEYFFNGQDVTTDTFKKLSQMECVKKLNKIALRKIPSTSDFNDLFKFCFENKEILSVLDFGVIISEDHWIIVSAFLKKIAEADYAGHEKPSIQLKVSGNFPK